MPLSLTLTQGVLPEGAEAQAIDRITQAFLAAHGLAGNRTMTPNVTAHVSILPKGATYSGGKPVEGAWLETKTPSFALADREIQNRFFREATEILHELSGRQLPKDRIWANGVHTVDGTWNMNGTPMTNTELGSVIGQG